MRKTVDYNNKTHLDEQQKTDNDELRMFLAMNHQICYFKSVYSDKKKS